MDVAFKGVLKRDIFVQGLLLKWQEKVLPSAKMFANALYQARTAEEQERQLGIMHRRGEIPLKREGPVKGQQSVKPPRSEEQQPIAFLVPASIAECNAINVEDLVIEPESVQPLRPVDQVAAREVAVPLLGAVPQ